MTSPKRARPTCWCSTPGLHRQHTGPFQGVRVVPGFLGRAVRDPSPKTDSPQPPARGVVVSLVEQLDLAASVICSGCCSWCSSFHLLELLSSQSKVQCCLVNSPSKILKTPTNVEIKKGKNSGLAKVSFGLVIFHFPGRYFSTVYRIFDFDRERRGLSCVSPCIDEHAFRFIL